jgi:hypothetical protein
VYIYTYIHIYVCIYVLYTYIYIHIYIYIKQNKYIYIYIWLVGDPRQLSVGVLGARMCACRTRPFGRTGRNCGGRGRSHCKSKRPERHVQHAERLTADRRAVASTADSQRPASSKRGCTHDAATANEDAWRPKWLRGCCQTDSVTPEPELSTLTTRHDNLLDTLQLHGRG